MGEMETIDAVIIIWINLYILVMKLILTVINQRYGKLLI